MLGVVFTEFLEMVAVTFSDDMVDDIVESSDLPSGGAYTAVGKYHHTEIVKLATRLSERTGRDVDDLIRQFGRHLFGRFTVRYPDQISAHRTAFDLFSAVENHIHREVKKLYPEAQLPTILCDRSEAETLILTYTSERPFRHLAHGLIEGTLDHFGEKATIQIEDLSSELGSKVRFTIRKA